MSERKNTHNMISMKNFLSVMKALRAKSDSQRFTLMAIFFGVSLFAFATVTYAKQDVLLVLDNSGSMKKNDPEFLAKSAVGEFIESLSGETKAGVIIFDQRVTLAVPLVELDGPNRRLLTNSLDDINYRGQLTDSPAAVERAIYELKTNGRENASKYIVFMTDGIVDTGNAAADVEKTKWLREELAADAADNGIKDFAVAFTENADFFLIQSLAKKSNGEYFRALSPSDLSGVFAEMQARIEQPAQTAAIVAPEPEIDQNPVADPTRAGKDIPIEDPPINKVASEPEISIPETSIPETPVPDTLVDMATNEASKIATSKTSTLANEDAATKDDGEVDAETASLLASISAEDLEALREISEIEGIPIEQLARELYGSGEEADASPGVVITRPGEPSVIVEPENTDVLVSIIAAAAGLLALVILMVWFIRRKRKQTTADGERGSNNAPVAVQAPAAFLHDISGLAAEPLINLDSQPLMVGRVAGTPDEHLKYLVVNAPTVGRRHAVVKYKDKAFWLVDQGSVNGTYVNDNRLSGECQLRHGDRIRFHNAEFEFTQPDTADAGETMIGEAVVGDATIVADAATMVGLAAAAPAVAEAADANDMFAGDINISSDADQELTLEGSEEAGNIETPVSPDDFAVPTNISLEETSIDEIFDVTGEDVVPAVLEGGNAQASGDGATQVLDATELPDTGVSAANAEALAGVVAAPTSSEVDHEFDAEASAFFDDNTVGPVVQDDDEDIFSVDGGSIDAGEQAALDEKLDRARALAEAEGESESPATEAVDFNQMDTMLNMEAPPPEDPNDLTLDDFIETNAFQASPEASKATGALDGATGTVSLDRFVDSGKFDLAQADETMVLDEMPSADFDETAVLPTSTNDGKADEARNEETDDGSDFFDDGSEDPTEMR
jgi:Mg-chelatase subunit ChlD